MLKFCGCASMASCTRWEWLQHSKAIFRMHDVCTITQEWNSIACKHACWSNLLFTYCRNNDYMCQNWYICLLNHVDTHNAERILYAYLNAVDTEACMCRVCPNITMCVRMSVGSRNRTIHNVCHISLHVSSIINASRLGVAHRQGAPTAAQPPWRATRCVCLQSQLSCCSFPDWARDPPARQQCR